MQSGRTQDKVRFSFATRHHFFFSLRFNAAFHFHLLSVRPSPFAKIDGERIAGSITSGSPAVCRPCRKGVRRRNKIESSKCTHAHTRTRRHARTQFSLCTLSASFFPHFFFVFALRAKVSTRGNYLVRLLFTSTGGTRKQARSPRTIVTSAPMHAHTQRFSVT